MALNPPGDIVTVTIFSGSLYAVCSFPPWCLVCIPAGARQRRSLVDGCRRITANRLDSDINHYLHEVFSALMASCVTYWW